MTSTEAPIADSSNEQVRRNKQPIQVGISATLLTARNGAEFTGAVISRAAEGSLLSSEAADLLGVKVKTLPSIAEHIFGDPLSLD